MNDNTEASLIVKVWEAVKPWLTGKLASGAAGALIIGVVQHFVLGLQREAEVGAAKFAATLTATQSFGEKTARRVDDVASVTAKAVSTACVRAIEESGLCRMPARKAAPKPAPKETGSLW
jgi:hypothetical protein